MITIPGAGAIYLGGKSGDPVTEIDMKDHTASHVELKAGAIGQERFQRMCPIGALYERRISSFCADTLKQLHSSANGKGRMRLLRGRK